VDVMKANTGVLISP